MRGIFVFLLCALAVLFLSSCGELTRTQLGGPNMSPADIAFAQNMVREPNWIDMRMTFNNQVNYTDKWCSDLVPAFPVMYWTTLGSYKDDTFYAVRKVATVFPVFYVVKDCAYDSKGVRLKSGFEFNLATAVWFERSDKEWRTGLVWLPGLGPCIGFGSDFFQFIWIPFSEF